MRTFIYGAEFEPGERKGTIVVSFPDVPEAVTQGDNFIDATEQAEDALGLALLTYPERGLPLPIAKAKRHHLIPVSVLPDVAAKLALIDTFTAAKITKSEFARRIGKDEKEARRLLDPTHSSKLPALSEALVAFGKRLIVGVDDIKTGKANITATGRPVKRKA
jgi:antitoxin HicB